MKTSRKDDILEELQKINQKELKDKVDKIGYNVSPKDKAHHNVMYFDLLIKLLMAAAVCCSFVYIVYTGNVDAMSAHGKVEPTSSGGNFQLLSVVGPLFGMVLQYYFGKNKAGANGE